MKSILVTIQSDTDLKICIKCGSSTTYIDPKGYERWGHLNKDKSKPLCKKCSAKEYGKNNPEIIYRNTRGWEKRNPNKVRLMRQRTAKKHPETRYRVNHRRMLFKNKIVMLDENPRTGVCSECGKSVHKGEIKKTDMHHEQYIDSNPLKETKELCVPCHNRKRKEIILCQKN